jgi:DNA-binding GntR family transcriptional regulator
MQINWRARWHTGGVEAWRQVADDLTRRITSGEYPPGTALPSVRALMETYGRADRTVLRALAHLREARLIEADSTRGNRVTGTNAQTLEARVASLEEWRAKVEASEAGD